MVEWARVENGILLRDTLQEKDANLQIDLFQNLS
jgi:hypothetical protein